MMLTIKEVATELSVSRQWLKYWLVENPVDEAGVPFYVPMGKRLKFERGDIERILVHMRKLKSARLGFSGKSKARLAGLLSKVDGSTEELRRMGVPSNERHLSTEILGQLAVSSVLGPRPIRRARVRLPRAKLPTKPIAG